MIGRMTTTTNNRTTMRALETYYAGITFRSRLEARWAWVFDRIGWDWQYEPQGYEVKEGWYCDQESTTCVQVGTPIDPDARQCFHTNYLPDFYANGHWYEVKGKVTADVVQTMVLASLDARGGLPLDPWGTAPEDRSRNTRRITLLQQPGRLQWTFRFSKGLVDAVPEPFADPDTTWLPPYEWGPAGAGANWAIYSDVPEWGDLEHIAATMRQIPDLKTAAPHPIFDRARRLRFENGRLRE